jgi:hypothetical protein
MKKGLPTMVEIDDMVISLDVVEKRFFCDLASCKGVCCVHGESGAPLDDDEVKILEDEYPSFKNYLRSEGIDAIEKQGTSVIDVDQEMVTPLIDGRECAYAIFEDGIARCGIEKAYDEGDTSFRKPVSCHIYPIRIKRYNNMTAVNYDLWPICDDARIMGENKDVPVFRFVRDAVERKFGQDFYKKLEILSDQIEKDHE